MQAAPTKLVRELDQLVRPFGWTWERTKGGHVKFRGPNGGMVVVSSSKGSSPHLRKAIIGDFRKQGVPV